MLTWLKTRKRRRLRTTPLPAEWQLLISRNVPYTRLLPPDDREELYSHVQILLAEKEFAGCAGLEITDEIRLTVAAQAALLLLHRDTDYYPLMQTILVYPGPFVAQHAEYAEDGTVTEHAMEQAGESWYRGPVILSWKDVLESAADPHDAYNVVLHEFAHQLDDEGGGEGAPALEQAGDYRDWQRAFGRVYADLEDAVLDGRAALLDEYGAESPAEFFAVATECFFERPRALKRRHRDLYEQLKGYYRQDPAKFVPQ